MADFKTAEKLTAFNEGGFVCDPQDRGGMTINGIARTMWPGWEGWKLLDAIIARVGLKAAAVDAEVAKNPTLQAMMEKFYKKNFWDVNNLDAIKSQRIANEMYDTGVNQGVGTAAKFLQEALNLCNKNGQAYPEVGVDGAISATGETIRTLNGPANEVAILNTLNMLQGERYLKIMRANKTQEKFWSGWMKRVVLTEK